MRWKRSRAVPPCCILIVAARGALNSLMTEVIEDHIRLHVVDPVKDAERVRGAEELIDAVQAYLK